MLFSQRLETKTNPPIYSLSFYLQGTQDIFEADSQFHPAYGFSSVESVFSVPRLLHRIGHRIPMLL